MTANLALARTILLMRRNLGDNISDALLLSALQSVQVLFVADELNLASPAGQHAFMTSVLLTARSGAACFIDAPNVPALNLQAPYTQPRVVDALVDIGADLIPGQHIAGVPYDGGLRFDVAIILGDSPFYAEADLTIRLSGTDWEGRIAPAGARWAGYASPFGALAAAGLAAAEAFKAAMRRLRPYAGPGPFDDYFRAAPQGSVRLAPVGTPPPTAALGMIDFVSGGAVTQSALYALGRIPAVTAAARVFEADAHDLTNLNRYGLLRRSGSTSAKGAYLERQALGGVRLKSIPYRFDEENRHRFGQLAANILVGVDNVESRWLVQRENPAWLGIGATEDYLAMRTVHAAGMPCAKCVHDVGGLAPGYIPTVAFVSHWSGLALAAAYAQHAQGIATASIDQVARYSCLQLGGAAGVHAARGWHQPDCGNACSSLGTGPV